MNNLKLSNEIRDKIFYDFILPSITDNIKSPTNPTAHVLGGQPAAGKSHFIKKLIEQDKNTVIINGDDFRGYHPGYNYFLRHNEQEAADLTQQDVNYWIEKAIAEISLRKYSIIIEGTLKNANVIIKTAKLLNNTGYLVNVDVILVNPEISKADMIKRYLLQKQILGFSRFTKIDAQINTVSNLFDNIIKIADKKEIDYLRLFRREIEDYNLFYERKFEKNSEYNEVDLKRVLEAEQKRELSRRELEYIKNSWEKIIELSKEYSEVKEYVQKVRETKIDYKLRNSLKHNKFKIC